MASYGRSNFFNSIPVVTKNLLIINFLMWLATWAMKSRGFDLNQYLAMHFWQADNFNLAQVVTYMFMHDTSSMSTGLMHIFCNMFNLWMFGTVLERAMGQKRFLTYYMVCGIGAALLQQGVWQLTWVSDLAPLYGVSADQLQTAIAAGQVQDLPMALNMAFATVGASGAVFGILLAFGFLFPNLRMFIIPFPFPIKAKWMVLGYGAFELFFGMTGTMSSVAHFAHLGGMLFGLLLLLWWKRTGQIGNTPTMY